MIHLLSSMRITFLSLSFLLLISGYASAAASSALDITCGKKLVGSAQIVNIDRILDGDTADVVIIMQPKQFGIRKLFRYRLLGNDTPEKTGESKPEGLKATAAATSWLTKNKDHLIAEFYGTGKFGRALTIIRSTDNDETLNEFLIKNKHHTRGTEPYCGGRRN